LRDHLPGRGTEVLERLDDGRVELRAGAVADLGDRVLDTPGVLVRALVDEHVEDVRDVGDPRHDRDVLARQAVRVALPVPALVVVAHDPLGDLEQLGVPARQHPRSE
jgi:hypothetical protein